METGRRHASKKWSSTERQTTALLTQPPRCPPTSAGRRRSPDHSSPRSARCSSAQEVVIRMWHTGGTARSQAGTLGSTPYKTIKDGTGELELISGPASVNTSLHRLATRCTRRASRQLPPPSPSGWLFFCIIIMAFTPMPLCWVFL